MNLFIGEIKQNLAILSQDETHHCNKVLRKTIGDKILITNGKGQMVKAKISAIHKKQLQAHVLELLEVKKLRNYTLHLAIAPTKSMDRLNFMIEKAVEIGVDEITIIVSQNSERRKINLDKVRKTIHSAVKQSMKAYVPHLHPPSPYEDFISAKNVGFIAHCKSDETKKKLTEIASKLNTYTILIGPEGDFTQEEIDSAKHKGWQTLDLGEERLRTETAGLAVVVGLKYLRERS